LTYLELESLFYSDALGVHIFMAPKQSPTETTIKKCKIEPACHKNIMEIEGANIPHTSAVYNFWSPALASSMWVLIMS